MKLKEKIASFIYRLLRSEKPNNYNACVNCKAKRKNLPELSYKEDHFIGYDKILAEWVVFSEHNFYVKAWVMNGYVVDILKLDNKLCEKIKQLCRVCITNYVRSILGDS